MMEAMSYGTPWVVKNLELAALKFRSWPVSETEDNRKMNALTFIHSSEKYWKKIVYVYLTETECETKLL